MGRSHRGTASCQKSCMLRRRLVTDGIPYAQFRSELRDEILVSRLRQREVDSRVVVTETDIDQFLRDQEGGNDPASLEVNLAQILVAVPLSRQATFRAPCCIFPIN